VSTRTVGEILESLAVFGQGISVCGC